MLKVFFVLICKLTAVPDFEKISLLKKLHLILMEYINEFDFTIILYNAPIIDKCFFSYHIFVLIRNH